MPSLTDNTAKWGVRKLTKFQENSGIPVGFEYFSTNPNIPAGSIPLFGGEYSREVYSDLWSWVQEQAGYLIEESAWQEKSAANNGNVPFYSKGDGTTTFRVPSLKCWVKGANGIEEVGSYLSAGLPILPDMSHTHERGTMNITGEITYITAEASNISNDDYPTTGAFRWGDEAYARRASLTSGEGSRDLNFDASRSWTGETSSASLTRTTDIYGNSDTVQPKSIVGMWLVKAYGTVTNVGNTDVSNIAQGLTELENRVTPIANGGTGATTAANARTNLGIDDIITTEGGITPISFGQVGTPTGTDKLVIKKVHVDTDDVPNNGILLEYGSTAWTGQLYFSDNDYTGVWFNGWAHGVRGEWKRLAWISDVTASKTNGIVEQSSNHVKFANGFLLMFYQFNGGGVKTVYPNSASYWAAVDTGTGGFNPGVTRVNSTQVNIQNVRHDTSTWCIGMGWA